MAVRRTVCMVITVALAATIAARASWTSYAARRDGSMMLPNGPAEFLKEAEALPSLTDLGFRMPWDSYVL